MPNPAEIEIPVDKHKEAYAYGLATLHDLQLVNRRIAKLLELQDKKGLSLDEQKRKDKLDKAKVLLILDALEFAVEFNNPLSLRAEVYCFKNEQLHQESLNRFRIFIPFVDDPTEEFYVDENLGALRRKEKVTSSVDAMNLFRKAFKHGFLKDEPLPASLKRTVDEFLYVEDKKNEDNANNEQLQSIQQTLFLMRLFPWNAQKYASHGYEVKVHHSDEGDLMVTAWRGEKNAQVVID